VEIKLSRPTAYPADLFGPLRDGFNHIYQQTCFYRQTGIVLAGLVSEAGIQYTLFDDPGRIEKMARIYNAVDELSEKFGKHTILHATSLPTKLQAQHEGERDEVPKRVTDMFKGENRRQRVGLPMLNVKV
jgi:hypothetical protein